MRIKEGRVYLQAVSVLLAFGARCRHGVGSDRSGAQSDGEVTPVLGLPGALWCGDGTILAKVLSERRPLHSCYPLRFTTVDFIRAY